MVKTEFLRLFELLLENMLLFAPDLVTAHLKASYGLFKFVNQFVQKSADQMTPNNDDFSRTEFLKLCINFQTNFIHLWSSSPTKISIFNNYRLQLLLHRLRQLESLSQKIIDRDPLRQECDDVSVCTILFRSVESNLGRFLEMIPESEVACLESLRSVIVRLFRYFADQNVMLFGNGVLLEDLMGILKTLLDSTKNSASLLDLDVDILVSLYHKHNLNTDFCQRFLYLLDSLLFHWRSFPDSQCGRRRAQLGAFLADLLLEYSQWHVISPLRNVVSDTLNSLSCEVRFLIARDKKSFFKLFKVFLLLSQDESQLIRMNAHSNLLWMIRQYWSFNQIINADLGSVCLGEEGSDQIEQQASDTQNTKAGSDASTQGLIAMVREKDSALTVNSSIGLKWTFQLLLRLIHEHIRDTRNAEILVEAIVVLGTNVLTKYLRVNKKNYIDKGIDYFFLPDKLNKFEELVVEQEMAREAAMSLVSVFEKMVCKEEFKVKMAEIQKKLWTEFEKVVLDVFGSDPEYIAKLGLDFGGPSCKQDVYDEKDALIVKSRKFWKELTGANMTILDK